MPRPRTLYLPMRLAVFAAAGLTGASCGGGAKPAPLWRGFDPTPTATRVLDGGLVSRSLLVANVTGDGSPDVLTVGGSPRRLLLLRGDGRGGLGAPEVIGGDADPRRAAVADFDGDGRVDIALLGYFDDGFRLLRGTGGGAFTAGESFPLDGHGRLIAAGDLDRDGRADVVVVSDGSARPIQASAYRGDGRGGLTRVWAERTPYATSLDLSLADADADGVLDILVASDDPAAHVLGFRGRGDGTFATAVPRPKLETTPPALYDGTQRAALLDTDGDHRPDLVTLHAEPEPMLAVRPALPGGGYGPARRAALPPMPVGLALGDVDRDGRPDAAIAHADPAGVTVRPLTDGGAFAPVTLAAPGMPVSVALADMDGDGWPDLIVNDMTDGGITVYRNRGASAP